MDDLISEFVAEAGENLDVIDAQLVQFETDPTDKTTLNNIFRLLHTIKGTCGFLGLGRLERLAHAGETLLDAFRSERLAITPAAVTCVLEAIDAIKDILGGLAATGAEPGGDDDQLIAALVALSAGDAKENDRSFAETDRLVTATADLSESLSAEPLEVEIEGDLTDVAEPARVTADVVLKAEKRPVDTVQSVRVDVDILEAMMTLVSELVLTRNQLLQLHRQIPNDTFTAPLQRLSTITGELQDRVMRTRMQPIGNAWKKLPRIVRDLSRDLGKKIVLTLEGESTELDRQLLDIIRDPLTHMVRNSADHGVEAPEVRKAAGKPSTGHIRLSAYHESGSIVVRLADDGRGLDVDRIKAKAIERNIITAAEAEAMTEQQAFRLIFAPGFSTAEQVTSVSGRGVGMDVVRNNIEQIGGHVDIASTLGEGSVFTIKIPLTLAIMPALVVGASGQRFALPQANVIELVRAGGAQEHRIETIRDVKMIRLREALLPLVELGPALDLNSSSDSSFVVIMQIGNRRYGVAVDDILDTEEIVVKPVAGALREIPHFSGSTILGDGSVVLILEPNTLAKMAGESPQPDDARAEIDLVTQTDRKETLLIVRAGDGANKAISMTKVGRLEHLDLSGLEYADGWSVTPYRNRMMAIFPAPGAVVGAGPVQPTLVLSGGDFTIGLAVDEIIDMVEDCVEIEISAQNAGVLGVALVGGRPVEIIDADYYLKLGRDRMGAKALAVEGAISPPHDGLPGDICVETAA